MSSPESKITLDADAAAVTQKTLNDAVFGCRTLAESLRSGTLTPRLAKTVLYLIEAHVADLGKAFGVETDSESERERRYGDLRAANTRVRELERLLGAGVSGDAIKSAIKRAADGLYAWWRQDGFGHVSEISFNAYGSIDLKLSTNLFGNFSLTNSKTPVSDRDRKAAWHQSLADKGFELDLLSDSGPDLLDSDQSREALRCLVLTGLPSASIQGYSNMGRRGVLVLTDVRLHLPSVADALALADHYLALPEED